MAAALHTDIDQKAISAMAAALVSIGKRVGSALGSGEPRGVQIDGVDKLIVVRSLKGASLIASAPSDAKIGLIDFEIEKVIGEIESVL